MKIRQIEHEDDPAIVHIHNSVNIFIQTTPTSHPATKQVIWKKLFAKLIPTIKSILLFFCLLFTLRFMFLLFHEGGHGLVDLIQGNVIKLLYAHPFYFSGYVRPIYFNRVVNHAMGPVMAVLVPLLIFIPLWKRRSATLLPLVMIFPWAAIQTGIDVSDIGRTGDYHNIIHLTRLPQAVITIPCVILLVIGLFFFLSLIPLLGLGPKNWRPFLVLPMAILLWSGVSILVAHLVVPGSPVDVIYHEGTSVIRTAKVVWQSGVVIMVVIAAIYLTLYRLIYPRLPAWLKSETVQISWNDLRIPALAAAACVIAGLILIH